MHKTLYTHKHTDSDICLHKAHTHTCTHLSTLVFTHPEKSNTGQVILVLKDDRCRCQKTSRKITTIIFYLATAALKILIRNYSFHL